MAISAERRVDVVQQYRTHGNDSGSPEVQVALLTERIKELTEHLKLHKHDFASRRGLSMMVSKRTRLTNYLREVDRERYLDLIKRLGLRK
ncbi:MAG: 30S ribosomal protein S15 [Planctomycetota bacterium]|nr:30S ribosomal protein S15 [Planctomycetota bacterium]